MTAMVLSLLGCSAKKEASKAQVAGWFKAAAANDRAKATASTTTTPERTTTTVPATSTTVPALVRLAQSQEFRDAAAAQRLADQRCQQLSGGRVCATLVSTASSPAPRAKPKASAKTKAKSPTKPTASPPVP